MKSINTPENAPESVEINGELYRITGWYEAVSSTPVVPHSVLKNAAMITMRPMRGGEELTRYMCLVDPESCLTTMPRVNNIRAHVAWHSRRDRMNAEIEERKARDLASVSEEKRIADREANEVLRSVYDKMAEGDKVSTSPVSTPAIDSAPSVSPSVSRIREALEKMEKDLSWVAEELNGISDEFAEIRENLERMAESGVSRAELTELRRKATRFDQLKRQLSEGDEDG